MRALIANGTQGPYPNSHYNVATVYGDYYLTEAALRLFKLGYLFLLAMTSVLASFSLSPLFLSQACYLMPGLIVRIAWFYAFFLFFRFLCLHFDVMTRCVKNVIVITFFPFFSFFFLLLYIC